MHYLEAELRKLLAEDLSVLDFLEKAALDGVWYWDLEQPEHEWMGPTFWRTLGFDPGEREHLAAAWQDLIDPDDLQVALANFERHKADPDHPYDQVVRYRHKNGSTVWVRCRGRMIRDGAGQPVRMLGTHNDVTPLKRLERALKEANTHLERFAASAAHDLRSPSRHIQQLVAMILEDHGDDLPFEVRLLLAKVNDRARWSMTLVDDLLRFARASQQVDRRTLDLRALLERARELVVEGAGGLQFGLAATGEREVVAGETGLLQVLRQLLGNAVAYRLPGRPLEVRVTCERDEDGWTVAVEDNGQGVPGEQLANIFQPFHRLHGESHVAGTGLGLAMCRRIIETGGGRIWAEPSATGGLAVRFTLPVEQPDDAAAASWHLAPGQRRFRSVLVVDDSPEDSMLLERELRKSERVDAVRSVAAVVDVLELYRDPAAAQSHDPAGFPPDLVIADTYLPGGGAALLLEELQRLSAAMGVAMPKVVLVTDRKLSGARRDFGQLPAVHRVLAKPLTRAEVIGLADEIGRGL